MKNPNYLGDKKIDFIFNSRYFHSKKYTKWDGTSEADNYYPISKSELMEIIEDALK